MCPLYIIDHVKGGLRWPVARAESANRLEKRIHHPLWMTSSVRIGRLYLWKSLSARRT